jgi:hypothetical protein
MTAIRCAFVVLAVALVAACGASKRDVKAARAARYAGEPATIFQVVAETVAATYEVQATDPVRRIVTTKPRWYRQDGTYDHREDDTFSREVKDHRPYVELSYEVTLSVDAPYRVEVVPLVVNRVTWQRIETFGAPAEPLPGWVQDRADELLVAIRGRLGPYAVDVTP